MNNRFRVSWGITVAVAVSVSLVELMPVRFLHLNLKMARGLLNIRKRQVPIGVRDADDLVEPRHRLAHVCGIGHRLLADMGKGEGRGRQGSFPPVSMRPCVAG